jgi:hypothetical protein
MMMMMMIGAFCFIQRAVWAVVMLDTSAMLSFMLLAHG